jgi:hypothetical protein
MNNRSLSASAVLGITLGFGIVIGGYFIGDAVYKIRASERYVTVKGLAERIVEADLAIWPITFQETGNDLSKLQHKVDIHRKLIREFLATLGFDHAEISELPPQITDFQADRYVHDKVKREYRYMAQTTLTLRTNKVSLVKQAMERSGELVSKGIVMMAEDYYRSRGFLFTGLNKIKPEMIAEATKNARKVAEQFAKDSGSTVGTIRKAQQGLFSIEDRDRNTPDQKKVRVVTTVEYFLVGD